VVFRAISVAVAALATAAAQPLPDAQTLYDRAQAAVRSFHSLQFTAESTMSGLPGPDIKTEMSSAYLNPGKSRMEVTAAGITFLNVSDGETTWIYNSSVKQYAKFEAAEGPAAALGAMGVKMPDVSSIHASYRTSGEESIEIDGQKHECWTVEMEIAEFALPDTQGVQPPPKASAVMTSWIDKKLGIDLQSTLDIKMHIAGKDMEMHQKMVKKNIEIDNR
jgi:outer membrane lipoprotein-sorting protein